jgi:long-chain fatty acid transport protein
MTSMTARIFYQAGGVAIMLLFLVTTSHAAGFYAVPKGAVGVGSAQVGGAARASDGSTVYFNPAGMILLDGTIFQGGIDFVIPDIAIRDTGSTATTPGTGGSTLAYTGVSGFADEVAPIPNLFFAMPLSNDDYWFGVALTAPFGLALDYGKDWYGRYDSIESELITINVSPSIAYRISDTWSIGGGLNIEYADATLNSALPNTLNPGGPTVATDGLGEMTGDAWDLGFNVGLLYRTKNTQVGLHYRSGIDHKLEGKTTISGLTGPLVGGNGSLGSSVGLDVPPITSFAIVHDLNDTLKLLADVQWFGWSSFDEIRIRFDAGGPDSVRPQGFKDSLTVGLALEYEWRPKWTLRAGVQFDETPTVDLFRNSSIPDADQVWLGFGASYERSDKLIIDLGFVHSDFDASTIDLTIPFFGGTPAAGTINTAGRTDNKVNIISIDLRYRF